MEQQNEKKEASAEGSAEGGRLVWKPRVPLFDNSSRATGGTGGERVGTNGGRQRITRDAEDMLVRAWRRPDLALTALYKDLGLSGYKGVKCKKELMRGGLADESPLPTNRRGPRKKLLQVTPKGREYLGRLGITQGRKGRGGVRHVYYQKKIKDWYEIHGWTAEVEAKVGDTSFDVLVVGKDGNRIGIEIALSEQYEVVNARKALESGVERVLFVCETEELMVRLREKIWRATRNWPGERPGFKLVSDYLEE
jgi:hypothetical protein